MTVLAFLLSTLAALCLYLTSSQQRQRAAPLAPVWRFAARGARSHRLRGLDPCAESVTTRYPDARREVGVAIPTTSDGEVIAYWYDGKNWQNRSAEQMGSSAPPAANATPEGADLAHFIYDLHYSLAIPEVGIYLMGVLLARRRAPLSTCSSLLPS